jgi:hypothetical protein
MVEETITCSNCEKELVMKFVEIKDLIFCSNQCLDTYIKTFGQKKFNVQYSDYFVSGEAAGWVPKYANDYMQMCIPCRKGLADACHGELEIGSVYHDALAEHEEYHWCCHARYCLSASLSDGTVPFDAGLRIQRYAEGKAKEQGIRGVTTILLSQSFADLATDFSYHPMQENPPKIVDVNMSHLGACLLCNESFGRQCEAQVEREFGLVEQVKPLLDKQWCSHTVCSLADMLIDRAGGEELLKKIIPYTDQVAQENGNPGVTTRVLFISLGRMSMGIA